MLYFGRFPRNINFVQSNKSSLNISSCTKFFCGSKNDAFCPTTNILEHILSLLIIFCIMNKTNFIIWNTFLYQFIFYKLIHIKRFVSIWNTNIRKNHLCSTVFFCFIPYFKHFFCTFIKLSICIRISRWIKHPNICRHKFCIMTYFKHIIYRRIYWTVTNFFCTLDKRIHIILYRIIWLGLNNIKLIIF